MVFVDPNFLGGCMLVLAGISAGSHYVRWRGELGDGAAVESALPVFGTYFLMGLLLIGSVRLTDVFAPQWKSVGEGFGYVVISILCLVGLFINKLRSRSDLAKIRLELEVQKRSHLEPLIKPFGSCLLLAGFFMICADVTVGGGNVAATPKFASEVMWLALLTFFVFRTPAKRLLTDEGFYFQYSLTRWCDIESYQPGTDYIWLKRKRRWPISRYQYVPIAAHQMDEVERQLQQSVPNLAAEL